MWRRNAKVDVLALILETFVRKEFAVSLACSCGMLFAVMFLLIARFLTSDASLNVRQVYRLRNLRSQKQNFFGGIIDKQFIGSLSSLCKRVVFVGFYSVKYSVSPLLVDFLLGKQ